MSYLLDFGKTDQNCHIFFKHYNFPNEAIIMITFSILLDMNLIPLGSTNLELRKSTVFRNLF